MKKLITTLTILTLLLTGCTTPPVEELDCELYPTHVDCLVDDPVDDPDDPIDPVINQDFIDIYYLNDFHGAITESNDQLGFSAIASFIASRKETYPENVIVLAGGDMLQGSALSNYYNGLSTIDIMDVIGFDAFTLGNHEFDWGLDVVTQYFDEIESNGEADFPLLGANVFLKGTTTLPDHIDPYTIIEKGDVKIGVIGTMGYGLEYSIATSKVADYEFAYPVPIIEEYAIHLRTVEECDIVIWVGHDTGSINEDVANLEGDADIDGIFNGHSHSDYANGYLGIPSLQSGSNGEYVGYVRFNLDSNNDITSFTVDNISKYENAYLLTEDASVQALIEQFQAETDSLFNTPIIEPGASFNKSDLSDWIASVMRVSTGSDIAFQNYGGTRTSIEETETINLGVLYQIWPFDNVVKTVYLKGSVVKTLLSSGMAYDTELAEFEDDTLYKVATNDYVFDKTSNPFLDGEQIENTGLLMRDLAENELKAQSLIYTVFSLSNELQTTDLTN